MYATCARELMSRPVWQRLRIEQMASALGVPAVVLGLPPASVLELAQDRFLGRCEQLFRRWRVPSHAPTSANRTPRSRRP